MDSKFSIKVLIFVSLIAEQWVNSAKTFFFGSTSFFCKVCVLDYLIELLFLGVG